MAVVVVLLAMGALVACDPPPGQARLKITDGKTLQVSGPAATCTSPQEVIGEVLWPSFEWSGTVGGQAASLGLTGMMGPTIDIGILRIGGSTYQFGAGEGSVQQVTLSPTGTLRVRARLEGPSGSGNSVGLTAVITCPTWGTANVTGQVDEHVAGPLPACPGAKNPYGTWKLEGNATSGAWRALTFTSSGGTAIDGAIYAAGSSTWSATNQPVQPPAVVARSVGNDGRLHVNATLAPGGGATAPIQVSADLRCSIPQP